MIPLNDLQRHSQAVGDGVSAAVARVIASGWYVLGKEVSTFEEEFAAYCGVASCVGMANGTDALELAMRSLGVGAGAKVVTVGNAGLYSTIAIRSIGAQPVYVDVDPRSMLMSPAALAAADLSGVAAIVVTHLYGRLADMEEILRIGAQRSIPVIEDCAQAHGASRGGRRAGSFGALACFSFYPTKNLGAVGDGGAVVGSDPALVERLRQLRQYGWSKKYVATMAGGRNTRLDEMQAAILRAKLPQLDAWNARRREIGALYSKRLRNPAVAVDRVVDDSDVFHLYVVRTAHRESLARHCKERGITTDIHYPVPDHMQPIMGGASRASLAETERACAEVITLPCFPEMRADEVGAVADAVNAWRP
jgi:aminotransferase EvaB